MDFFSLSVLLCLVYLTISTIRNLFFHPLSDVPGPFLARISSLPSFYHASKGDRHLWIEANFKIYGTGVRARLHVALW